MVNATVGAYTWTKNAVVTAFNFAWDAITSAASFILNAIMTTGNYIYAGVVKSTSLVIGLLGKSKPNTEKESVEPTEVIPTDTQPAV